MSDINQEFNDGHITEGLDRLHIIQSNLEDYVQSHPSVVKAGCEEKIEEAIRLLGEAYQAIGQLSE